MSKDLVIKIIGTTLLSIVALWGIFNLFTKPVATPTKADLSITEKDVIRGKKDAPLTLVEYSDLQCPACAAYAPIVKQLVEKYDGKLKLVYRHFPLDQHKHAKKAAYAAEAAHKQGKFFEYQDVLFEKQSEWQDMADKDIDAQFRSYASTLKLDLKAYDADRKDSAIMKKVDADQASGITAGVNSTPTFFLNGFKLTNPRNLDEFEALISKELPKQEASPSTQ